MFKLLTIILIAVAVSFTMLIFTDCLFSSEQVNKEEWNPISAGPITTWTAPLCGKSKFVVQPFFLYNRTRGTFNAKGHYDSLPDDDRKYQFQEQFFMQYGLTEHLEIDAQFVYMQNYAKTSDKKAHTNDFGDSYAFLRYCALDETNFLPHTSALFQLKIPTGKYQHADPDKLGTDLMGATSGGGSWDPGFGLNLTKKLKPFVFHTDAIFSFSQEVRVDGVKTIYGKYLNYDAGIEYFLPKGFNLMLETNGFLQGDKWQDGERTPSSDVRYLTVAPGIGWSCDKIQILFAYQRVVIGTNTDANDSVVLTGVYTF
ncbi:MAG: transporter [Candidatus Omnitrophota bacterium]|nr:transporter [Candidatus Omnitrophota bacterium]